MEVRRVVAAYSLLIGVMMAAMWTVSALTGQIPEVKESPKEIAFHLAAEFVTAFALVVGGLGLATRRPWGFTVNLVALGMLAYTVIVSPGYYAQTGEYAFVGMFAVLIVLTVVFIVLSFLRRQELSA
jgi:peptidoglycan/LPS O-acetylase OafA/YrhL